MAKTIMPSYPSPPGNKNQVVMDFTGPSSYTQITVAAPATGGYDIQAKNLGLTSIDFAVVSGSDDGQYGARVIYAKYVGRTNASIKLEFFVLNTGAQVSGSTDLSARSFRIWAFGF